MRCISQNEKEALWKLSQRKEIKLNGDFTATGEQSKVVVTAVPVERMNHWKGIYLWSDLTCFCPLLIFFFFFPSPSLFFQCVLWRYFLMLTLTFWAVHRPLSLCNVSGAGAAKSTPSNHLHPTLLDPCGFSGSYPIVSPAIIWGYNWTGRLPIESKEVSPQVSDLCLGCGPLALAHFTLESTESLHCCPADVSLILSFDMYYLWRDAYKKPDNSQIICVVRQRFIKLISTVSMYFLILSVSIYCLVLAIKFFQSKECLFVQCLHSI